ncbi:helix-turn-helix transcriptional regulator [Clostridium sp. AM58-1XD]|uniref:helix-turn-helix domain-containing protein n=1 Tax=Clostridium sp. AM58-1XD TaxID=2292307 RepID=UPI00325B802F
MCYAVLSLKYGGIIMRLKQIRNNNGLSLRALSELSGVPQRTIEDLERRDDGRVSTMIKLADALSVTLDELCRNEAAE